MTRAEILDTAKGYVTRDRNISYDIPERNFDRIAVLWEAWDRIKGPGITPPLDVAIRMALMKLGRIAYDPSNEDSWADQIGYLACGAEIATGADDAAADLARLAEDVARLCRTPVEEGAE